MKIKYGKLKEEEKSNKKSPEKARVDQNSNNKEEKKNSKPNETKNQQKGLGGDKTREGLCKNLLSILEEEKKKTGISIAENELKTLVSEIEEG